MPGSRTSSASWRAPGPSWAPRRRSLLYIPPHSLLWKPPNRQPPPQPPSPSRPVSTLGGTCSPPSPSPPHCPQGTGTSGSPPHRGPCTPGTAAVGQRQGQKPRGPFLRPRWRAGQPPRLHLNCRAPLFQTGLQGTVCKLSPPSLLQSEFRLRACRAWERGVRAGPVPDGSQLRHEGRPGCPAPAVATLNGPDLPNEPLAFGCTIHNRVWLVCDTHQHASEPARAMSGRGRVAWQAPLRAAGCLGSGASTGQTAPWTSLEDLWSAPRQARTIGWCRTWLAHSAQLQPQH